MTIKAKAMNTPTIIPTYLENSVSFRNSVVTTGLTLTVDQKRLG